MIFSPRIVLRAFVCVLGMQYLIQSLPSAAASDPGDQPTSEVGFCLVHVPETSSRRIEDHAWSPVLIATVGIKRLPTEALQELRAKYKGRPPRPKLVPIVRYNPMIPFDMRALKIPGRAEAFIVVSRSGMVSDVYLADCTNEEYAQAIGLGLKSWRFEPLLDDCLIEVPIKIDLVPLENPK